ncbi:hypothetical protein Tco_0444102, partial [Tanacetum coccineum]
EDEIKSQSSSSSSSNSQNVAFVSLDDTVSSNGQASTANYAYDVISQMAGGHAYYKGEEILKEDKKESKFQWKRNWQDTKESGE